MKTEKEIKERINKIKNYILLSEEIGKVLSPQELIRLRTETRILEEVLGIETNKSFLEKMQFKPIQDRIIIFLRTQKSPVSYRIISSEINASFPSIQSALKRLVTEDKIERFGSKRNFLYKVKKKEGK